MQTTPLLLGLPCNVEQESDAGAGTGADAALCDYYFDLNYVSDDKRQETRVGGSGSHGGGSSSTSIEQ